MLKFFIFLVLMIYFLFCSAQEIDGLYWTNTNGLEKQNWDEANRFCSSSSIEGVLNWRLPTKDELVSISRLFKKNQNTYGNDARWQSEGLWSSSQSYKNSHWAVNLELGTSYHYNDSGQLLTTCVHSKDESTKNLSAALLLKVERLENRFKPEGSSNPNLQKPIKPEDLNNFPSTEINPSSTVNGASTPELRRDGETLALGNFFNERLEGYGIFVYDKADEFIEILKRTKSFGLSEAETLKSMGSFSGTWYLGQFKNGIRNGTGALIGNGKLIVAGVWENDKIKERINLPSQNTNSRSPSYQRDPSEMFNRNQRYWDCLKVPGKICLP